VRRCLFYSSEQASCAKVGLIALIDEATGYQYERAEDALQIKLHAFIAEELRAWENTFPDELWEEFGRLTNWQGPFHTRPKWWGKLVIELIYDTLDPDIAAWLKVNKPPPGLKWHQQLSESSASADWSLGVMRSSVCRRLAQTFASFARSWLTTTAKSLCNSQCICRVADQKTRPPTGAASTFAGPQPRRIRHSGIRRYEG